MQGSWTGSYWSGSGARGGWSIAGEPSRHREFPGARKFFLNRSSPYVAGVVKPDPERNIMLDANICLH
jgi:hypothetical protein